MKPPAYGRELLDARRRGLRPAPPFDVVWITDNWDLAKQLQDCGYFALVCQPVSAPYDFTLLFNLPVVVMTDSEDVLGLCERIARAQPLTFQVPSRAERIRYWWRATGEVAREDLALLDAPFIEPRQERWKRQILEMRSAARRTKSNKAASAS